MTGADVAAPLLTGSRSEIARADSTTTRCTGTGLLPAAPLIG
ncbi:hypothetical protein ACIRQP_07505 [Streptomyces sp. NPDC102274]